MEFAGRDFRLFPNLQFGTVPEIVVILPDLNAQLALLDGEHIDLVEVTMD